MGSRIIRVIDVVEDIRIKIGRERGTSDRRKSEEDHKLQFLRDRGSPRSWVTRMVEGCYP